MPFTRKLTDELVRGLLILILGMGVSFATAPSAAFAQDEDTAGQTSNEGSDDADADSETGDESNDESDEPDSGDDAQPEGEADGEEGATSFVDQVNETIEPVNQWFSDYLVGPMATFFFYDFHTGPRIESGQSFVDANENDTLDEGETINANMEVTVTDQYDEEQTVTTDENGNYRIVHSEGWLGVSLPFVVIWLLAGAIYLTLRMLFINVRGFFHAIALTMGKYDDEKDEGEVSHFQALSSALSATVGLGNIAGVAIAIGVGGPGATFWMILIGLLGMSSKFTECTLGQMYRKVDPQTGRVTGGPMRYLSKGLGEMGLQPLGTVLAVFFAVLCVGASLGGGNAFQVGQSLDAIREDITFIDKYPWIYGLVMAAGVGVVIVGGIKSIGKVASRIVPFMCAAYVLMAMYIIFTNLALVGPAFQSILDNAFNFQAGFGAILGVMVVGIQRAVFSNEAGVGSAAIAHSAAKTDEPVSEGIVALLEPFIDTVVICTMTAVVIIIAGGGWTPTEDPNQLLGASEYGAWSNPDYGNYVSGENKSGAALTRSAISGEHGISWFKYVLYAAVILFAYSTLISWYYYGERCWTSLFGEWSSFGFKALFLVFTVLGSIVTTGAILDFSDLLILSMALPNMLGLFILSGKVKRHLDKYWEKKKSGRLRGGK
ncbi:MAG: amino acid carrier protein [Planctomycetota bacterium]